MYYEAQKLDEIANRLGVSVAVLEQYLRAQECDTVPETRAAAARYAPAAGRPVATTTRR